MGKCVKQYLLAFCLAVMAASVAGAANTKFTNVEVTGTLTVDGSQTTAGNSTVTGNQTVTGNNTVSGKRVNARTTMTQVTTSTTVLPTAGFVVLQSTNGALIMASTPSISTTTATDGQFLVLKGTSSVSTFTFQDQGTLSGSLVELGASTRIVSDKKVLTLMFDSILGEWLETAYGNN